MSVTGSVSPGVFCMKSTPQRSGCEQPLIGLMMPSVGTRGRTQPGRTSERGWLPGAPVVEAGGRVAASWGWAGGRPAGVAGTAGPSRLAQAPARLSRGPRAGRGPAFLGFTFAPTPVMRARDGATQLQGTAGVSLSREELPGKARRVRSGLVRSPRAGDPAGSGAEDGARRQVGADTAAPRPSRPWARAAQAERVQARWD